MSDVEANQILDNFIDNWVPVIYRLMLLALVVLAFLGAVMATWHFDLLNPDLVGQASTWSVVYQQAEAVIAWPLTVAPLWWKLSFFVMGGLILLPRLLTIRD